MSDIQIRWMIRRDIEDVLRIEQGCFDTPWTEDDFTYQGQFFTIPRPITVFPRPVQQPHPQIWA